MRAMVLDSPGDPLRVAEVPVPEPGPEQVLLRVHACAVCRTDLHVVDGELQDPKLPLIPGHQIVGTVEKMGERVERFSVGDRVGDRKSTSLNYSHVNISYAVFCLKKKHS